MQTNRCFVCNREPKRGDLIEIFRDGYQHWAIYVGDGYVIHVVLACGVFCFSKPRKDGKVTVKKEKLKDVAGKDKYRINNHLDDTYEPRPIDEILQDAESLVGREIPYNMATNNCEHFVTLLRYGNPQSQQVRDLAAAALVFGILALATIRKKKNQDQ
uniref:LRAT domain-containing protein n=1 Tax=Cyprinus carpio TaxID=7962 RepID=A0A8C2BSP2_CYPCA